jgi:hypothetical protein
MIAVVKVICDDGGNVGGDDYGGSVDSFEDSVD